MIIKVKVCNNYKELLTFTLCSHCNRLAYSYCDFKASDVYLSGKSFNFSTSGVACGFKLQSPSPTLLM